LRSNGAGGVVEIRRVSSPCTRNAPPSISAFGKGGVGAGRELVGEELFAFEVVDFEIAEARVLGDVAGAEAGAAGRESAVLAFVDLFAVDQGGDRLTVRFDRQVVFRVRCGGRDRFVDVDFVEHGPVTVTAHVGAQEGLSFADVDLPHVVVGRVPGAEHHTGGAVRDREIDIDPVVAPARGVGCGIGGDPLGAVPVRRGQQAHLPPCRRAPLHGHAVLVPDLHPPCVALPGGEWRPAVWHVNRFGRVDDPAVPQLVSAFEPDRAFGDLDPVGGLPRAAPVGSQLPAEARFGVVDAERVLHPVGAQCGHTDRAVGGRRQRCRSGDEGEGERAEERRRQRHKRARSAAEDRATPRERRQPAIIEA
jgi:hypothetical protein